MLAFTYTYHTNDTEVQINGFLAFLLAQGEQWDYACVQADVSKYHKQAAVRGLKCAVADKNAAAAFAQEVYKLQQKAVMIQNIRPYSRFVEAVNKVCGSSVKQDSFTKHMRG